MKTIIFDFDGTIADTFPFVFDTVNALAPKYGHALFSREEIEGLRSLTFREIVKKFHIGPINLFRMTLDSHAMYADRMDKVKVFPGMAEVVRKLKKDRFTLAIMSSNSEANIKSFLAANQLDDVFDGIYTTMSLFGKGKKLIRMMRKLHFTPSETIYVGDEVRDVDAAREAGIGIVSVLWGYNLPELVRRSNDHVAMTPAELRAEIEKSFK